MSHCLQFLLWGAEAVFQPTRHDGNPAEVHVGDIPKDYFFDIIIIMALVCRQEEFYKLLAKHNILPPAGWAKSRLEQKKENS